jgi:hypothetical protein
MKMLNLAVLTVGHFEEIRKWRDAQRDILRTKEDMEPSAYRQLLIDDECRRYANENHLYGISHNGRFVAFGGLTHIKWGRSSAISAELSFISVDPVHYETAFMFHLRKSQDLWFRNSYYKGKVLISESYPFRKFHMAVMESVGFKKKSIIHELTREDYLG